MIEKQLLPDWVQSAEGFSALANDCIPIYEPGGTITAKASAAVTGKRFVKITADAEGGGFQGLDANSDGGNIVCGPCGAGEQAFGVANHDAVLGARFGVLSTPGLVVPVLTAGAIAAGEDVMSDATGKAVAYVAGLGNHAIGVCIADAANATDAPIKLAGAVVRGIEVGALVPQVAPVALVDNTGGAVDSTLQNVVPTAAADSVIAAAAATAVTNAMLTDATVDAAGVNAQLATLAADIIAKTKTGVDTVIGDLEGDVNTAITAVENNFADLAAKVNALRTELIDSGILTV